MRRTLLVKKSSTKNQTEISSPEESAEDGNRWNLSYYCQLIDSVFYTKEYMFNNYSAKIDYFSSLFYEDHINTFIEQSVIGIICVIGILTIMCRGDAAPCYTVRAGTGKSSIVLALAKKLNIPLF